MNSLEGIDIEDLVIDKEFESSSVRSQVAESIGCGLIIWEKTRSGKSIDLVGGADFGWLMRSTLTSMQLLADVPGATYTLLYAGSSRNVRFRKEDGAPISATPIVPRPNPEETDLYRNITIKLMEV